MMWQKYLTIIFLFYLFALLQNSFFVNFSLLGATLNLVFVFFFLLAFFVPENKNYQVIFLAILAGILLDIYSSGYLGPSIISLIVIGFLLKGAQSLLKNLNDKYPFAYFAPLFVVFFSMYEVITMSFDLRFVAGIVYNLLFASIGFVVFKKVKRYVE
jgi:rod shape-determining protein MreD